MRCQSLFTGKIRKFISKCCLLKCLPSMLRINTEKLKRENADVVGDKPVKNDAGEMSMSEDSKQKAWLEHYQRLQIDHILSYFFEQIGFDISCKLSPKETIFMRCQSLFTGKIRKFISKCCLLKCLPSMLRINTEKLKRENADVVGDKPVKNDAGEMSMSEDSKQKAWLEHYQRLLPPPHPPPPSQSPLI